MFYCFKDLVIFRVTSLGDFLTIRQLLEAHCNFEKIYSPKERWHFGLLFAKAKFCAFLLKEAFQNMFL